MIIRFVNLFSLRKTLQLISIVVFISACSFIETFDFINTENQPVMFVQGMTLQDERYVLDASDPVCLYVDESKLWEPGDFWGTHDNSPVPVVYIDSTMISEFAVTHPNILIIESDKAGNVVGDRSRGYTLCTIDLDLSPGSHTLSACVTSTSGIEYFLEREFVVVEDE